MPSDSDLIARMNARVPATAAMLGYRLLDADPDAGTVRARFEVGPQFCNPMGTVQGGIVATMLDDTAAIAAIVQARGQIVVPTLEFKVSFYAAARAGELFTAGRAVKVGARVAFLEADLFDPAGRLLARMSATVLPAPMPGKPHLVEVTA